MNKIQLCDKYKCTQCMACINVCPKKCIELIDTGEGFYIPQIDEKICVECSACIKACHRLSPIVDYQTPLKTLACWTKNDTDRRRSSSGGAFSVLARKVLSENGVVFGATMDTNLQVKHISIDNTDDIVKLQGSKYVQSYLGDTYKQVREFLRQERLVLFTGTPCQIGGLLTFLRKKYNNLITCDMVCHGVPSQRAFDVFCEKTNIKNTCQGVSFRFTAGWGFQLAREVESPIQSENPTSTHLTRKVVNPRDAWYMRAFNKGLMFNESCFSCAYTTPQRVSDFTMADYWGLGAETPFDYPTFRGVSMLLVNNLKAMDFINECPDLFYEERSLEEAIKGNHNLSHNSERLVGRDSFIQDMQVMEPRALVVKYGIKESLRDYLRLLKQWINSKRV
ncbi:MAG: Coenzyme F420 hydrogenase/dehydrogenase, beta subunit C-terminal domain [Bacteroidales bacterium]|nr:Coenzyme F420 hydrogenase/dehydrogenase, beta subunit C-terminal domain [Bacteroidales bacterium]